MIKILVDKQASNFVLRREYLESTGGSDDGMRRSYSYTVYVTNSFFFENEKKEKDGYSYDMRVVKSEDGCDDYDRTETPEEFLENFDYVATALRNRGITMLNFPTYMAVGIEFFEWVDRWSGAEGAVQTAPDENAFEISFKGKFRPWTPQDEVLTVDGLLTWLNEDKQLLIARALNCGLMLKRVQKVSLDSITDEFYGKKKLIKLKKVDIEELLSTGAVSEADVVQVLKAEMDAVAETGHCSGAVIDGVQSIVVGLPDEFRRKVVDWSRQTSACLKLLREYCPERIHWPEVKAEDYVDSDLDLMIQQGVVAHREAQWGFIDRCMAKPELERKVVENAGTLGLSDLGRIARNLRTAKLADLLHSVLRCRRRLDLSELSKLKEGLWELDHQTVDRTDYEACLEITDAYKLDCFLALALKVGLIAGVSEGELARMLQDKASKAKISLCCWYLKQVYEQVNFTPGLAWVKAEDERREAERARKAKAKAESHEKVVRFVQDSGELAVRVIAESSWSDLDGRKVSDLNGEEIGRLQFGDERLMAIEGRNSHTYFINLERVKNLKNGILHLDVAEEDAGYIIGPKGAKIKETTEKLNELGCNLKMIKLHKH